MSQYSSIIFNLSKLNCITALWRKKSKEINVGLTRDKKNGPQFYNQVVDVPRQAPEVKHIKKKPENKYREFMVSTTYKNVTKPLKMSILAKPFPEPVNTMRSHVVSDQEKADLMLLESKLHSLFKNLIQ